jgi:hypothetical protein
MRRASDAREVEDVVARRDPERDGVAVEVGHGAGA